MVFESVQSVGYLERSLVGSVKAFRSLDVHNDKAFTSLVLASSDLNNLQPLVHVVAHLVDSFYVGPPVPMNLKLVDHLVLHGRQNLSLLPL